MGQITVRAEKVSVHKFKRRAGWKDKHHWQNKCRQGTDDDWNKSEIDAYRHSAIHLLFGNRSLDEIIELLQRLKSIKELQRFKP